MIPRAFLHLDCYCYDIGLRIAAWREKSKHESFNARKHFKFNKLPIGFVNMVIYLKVNIVLTPHLKSDILY